MGPMLHGHPVTVRDIIAFRAARMHRVRERPCPTGAGNRSCRARPGADVGAPGARACHPGVEGSARSGERMGLPMRTSPASGMLTCVVLARQASRGEGDTR